MYILKPKEEVIEVLKECAYIKDGTHHNPLLNYYRLDEDYRISNYGSELNAFTFIDGTDVILIKQIQHCSQSHTGFRLCNNLKNEFNVPLTKEDLRLINKVIFESNITLENISYDRDSYNILAELYNSKMTSHLEFDEDDVMFYNNCINETIDGRKITTYFRGGFSFEKYTKKNEINQLYINMTSVANRKRKEREVNLDDKLIVGDGSIKIMSTMVDHIGKLEGFISIEYKGRNVEYNLLVTGSDDKRFRAYQYLKRFGFKLELIKGYNYLVYPVDGLLTDRINEYRNKRR